MTRPIKETSDIRPWETTLGYPEGFAPHVQAFTFAIISDPHCDETPSSARHSHGLEHLGDGSDRLRLCFDAIDNMKAFEKPSFIMLLGDIGIETAEPMLAEAPCPIHVIAGNHDWGHRRQRLRELFPSDFGTGDSTSDYYAFEHGGVRFIAICNAGTGNEHTGQLSSEDIRPPGQAAWIAEQMASARGPVILFGHCPPQPEGFDPTEYVESGKHKYLPFMGDCDSAFLTAQLRAHAPTAAFFGHLHRATVSYNCGSSRVHVLRSCNWNHDAQPIGFTQVQVDTSSLAMSEILTGRCKGDA